MLFDCVLVGLDWAEPMMQFSFAYHMFMHSHAYVLSFQSILIYLNCFETFLSVSFFSHLSLVYVSVSWHQSVNLLHLGTLCILGHLLLLIPPLLLFDSMISKPKRTSQRTSLDEAFIQNAKSFCRTSPTLTYLLSFTVEVGSHCVMSWSTVHPC